MRQPPVAIITHCCNGAATLAAIMSLCVALSLCLAEVPQPAPAATLQPKCDLPFQNNAVLQQLLPLPVWGTTLPGAQVTLSFNSQTKTTQADADGRWRVVLDPMSATRLTSVHKAPAGLTMHIVCRKDGQEASADIRNLLVGEVWLCAGQSNMAGKLRTNHPHPLPDAPDESPDYPALRQMVSPAEEPWLICTSETAKDFKKVCFYFARSVQHNAMIPLGIINAAVGGSKIEAWLNQEPYETGGHYTRLIKPLVGYGIRGAVWYQGESNARDKRGYEPKLRSLIKGWRSAWNQSASPSPDGPRRDFSFYFVQLPGIGTSAHDDPRCGDGRAEIRQAQLQALSLAHTGMAVTIDIGSVREHPPNKYDTGVRLARLALHNDYGFKNLTPTGPLYKSFKVEGRHLRIQFDHVGTGLMFATKQGFLPPQPAPNAPLDWLSIQAADGSWHWAKGAIDQADLLVWADDVPHPIAARYAYTNNPVGTLLYNHDGLPASPFTTCGYDDKQPSP